VTFIYYLFYYIIYYPFIDWESLGTGRFLNLD